MIHVLAAAADSPAFENVLVMSAAAFAVRLFLGFVPSIRVPGPVLEIVIGVIIGPQVLGWVVVDGPVLVLSTLGLAFLLFLAGMEVDVESLRGRDGRVAFIGFGISVVIALGIGFTLEASGLIINGLLVGFALTASSLGVLIPLLADEGELRSPLGRFVIAGASVGESGSSSCSHCSSPAALVGPAAPSWCSGRSPCSRCWRSSRWAGPRASPRSNG